MTATAAQYRRVRNTEGQESDIGLMTDMLKDRSASPSSPAEAAPSQFAASGTIFSQE